MGNDEDTERRDGVKQTRREDSVYRHTKSLQSDVEDGIQIQS